MKKLTEKENQNKVQYSYRKTQNKKVKTIR